MASVKDERVLGIRIQTWEIARFLLVLRAQAAPSRLTVAI